jgi:hypothetical protein
MRYLRFNCFPDKLVTILEKGIVLSPADNNIRSICYAANEIVEAFYAGKISSYSPENSLPTKSFLRLLPITSDTHQQILANSYSFLEDSKRKYREEEREKYGVSEAGTTGVSGDIGSSL